MVTQLPDGPGTCAIYAQGVAIPPQWRRVDVRAHCHRHQIEWTKALTQWHGELMAEVERATPWAWVVPGSRLHVWHESVRPFLFALGLLVHFRENPGGEVLAVGCPVEVGTYVRELSEGSIEVIGESVRHARRTSIRGMLRRLKEAVSILRRVRPFWRDRAPRAKVDLLIFSVGLGSANLRERGDHYFGHLLDNPPYRTHWLYQLRSNSDRRGIENELRGSGLACSFDHRLASWGDLLAAAKASREIRQRLRKTSLSVPELRICDTVSRVFPRRFFQDLFLDTMPLGELVLHRVMTRLAATLSPRAVCYPYEEKAVERALLMACAAAPNPIKTIAFAHAAYHGGYLYLRESPIKQLRPPRPSVIAAAGNALGPWLAAECGRSDEVVLVGSPRWRNTVAPKRVRRPGAPLQVLFITGFPNELLELVEWTDQRADLFAQCDVTIRPNPQDWYREQQVAFGRLRGAASFVVAADVSLDSQIAAADVVLFSSTSAVAEAVRGGRAAVHVELSDLWIADPLHGDAEAVGVPQCTTPAQLKETLRDIAAMDPADYERMVASQKVVIERIYAPFDHERFKDLVMRARPG